MKALFSYDTDTLVFSDDDGNLLRAIPAFSRVRNELNGERSLTDPKDVEHSENEDGSRGKPVMPRPFPKGNCTITGIEATDENWLRPWKLITDAHQTLEVWALKADGSYDKPSGETIEDFGYRSHFANGSHHTDGCIGQNVAQDILWCKQNVTYPCPLEVV